ncbi:MAG: amino acid permease [Fibrobacterota bacterium]
MKKKINTLDVFCIASGVMISSGIFILPGIAFDRTGPSIFVSYALAGAAALAGSMSMIELATAMPKAGGDYFFITRVFGPLPGILSGFFSWFAISLKTAFAVFGIAEVISAVSGVDLHLAAVVAACFFILLNLYGVSTAVKFEVVIVISLILIMITYTTAGITQVKVEKFIDFAPGGINSVFMTAGFVFISFGGLLKVAALSEEVDEPGKTLPAGIISAVVAVTLLYSLLLIVLVGTSEPENLRKSLSPVADSAFTFLGTKGYYLLSLAALLAFISTANAGIMSASRYPVALGKDGLLPAVFSRASAKGVPFFSVVFTGGLIIFSLFWDLEVLVKNASAITLAAYILTNVALVVIRESGVQNYSPAFRAPFYPWLQIFSAGVFIFLISEIGVAAVESIAILAALSVAIYLLYGRKHFKGEYALMYLVQRIINRDMTSNDLEDELRKILSSRDSIEADRFHELVEDSPVIDLEGPLLRNEFFSIVADKCPGLDTESEKDDFVKLMQKREDESSTAISSFIAVPHIIIEGEGVFRMVIARVKKGVAFSEKENQVKAVFVLAGSKDERQFHLQALSAIAQIAQSGDFQKKWQAARNSENLRDILLLGRKSG